MTDPPAAAVTVQLPLPLPLQPDWDRDSENQNSHSQNLNLKLFASIEAKDLTHVRHLVDSKADVNAARSKEWERNTPLMAACSIGFVEAAALLIATGTTGGAHVNTTRYDGATALVVACENGHRDVVKLLLDSNAQTEMKTKFPFGDTALSKAAENGHTAIIEMLLRHNASLVNTRTHRGKTALMAAAERNDVESAACLLSWGANTESLIGPSPLMIAARAGNALMVEMLLAHSCNMEACEKTNKETALMLAASRGHLQVCELLAAKGAVIAVPTATFVFRSSLEQRSTRSLIFASYKPAVVDVLSTALLRRGSTVDELPHGALQLPKVQKELRWTSRKNYISIVEGCHFGSHGHVVRYLFDEMVLREICSYLDHE